MRKLTLFPVLILLSACNRSSTTAPQSNEPKIGPQFWKYDLSEYSAVSHDVVSGLGGSWISVRYQRRPEHTIKREAMVARITTALQADGWKVAPLPERKYVLSKIWETSGDDLHFTRPVKSNEPAWWSFAETVFVSEEADTLAIYCEVGW